LNICVFASGSGSNFQALIDSQNKGLFQSKIKILITNNSSCGAVSIANSNNINIYHISRKKFPDDTEEEYDKRFLSALRENEIDLIVLAGYMKKISGKIISAFRNRIINIHPALLPSFGGEGMYGIEVHKAVIKKGVKLSGVTIHIVDENYDNGKILFQKSISVRKKDDEFTLQKRILMLEHKYYSKVIVEIEKNKIKI
jgi:phosphoribosylglycinamide formyltransferase 1